MAFAGTAAREYARSVSANSALQPLRAREFCPPPRICRHCREGICEERGKKIIERRARRDEIGEAKNKSSVDYSSEISCA